MTIRCQKSILTFALRVYISYSNLFPIFWSNFIREYGIIGCISRYLRGVFYCSEEVCWFRSTFTRNWSSSPSNKYLTIYILRSCRQYSYLFTINNLSCRCSVCIYITIYIPCYSICIIRFTSKSNGLSFSACRRNCKSCSMWAYRSRVIRYSYICFCYCTISLSNRSWSNTKSCISSKFWARKLESQILRSIVFYRAKV